MDKNKLILPISILLGCIIFGGFYCANEVNKQKSIKRQQQIDLQAEADEQQSEQRVATDQNYSTGYTEIENDGVFNAFPSIIKLSDTHFIVFYTKGTAEIGYKNTIVKKESTDAGVTWSSEVTVLTDATYSLVNAQATLLSNGNIIVSFMKETLTPPMLFQMEYLQ